MNPTTFPIPTRGPFDGVRQIVRFNWPKYVQAAAATLALLLGASLLPLPWWAILGIDCGATLAMGWLLMSLVVSHVVYDRSRLCRWRWIGALLDRVPATWVNIHAGFDESSAALGRMFPSARKRVLDIFDRVEMREPSIARARRLSSATVERDHADLRRLPIESGSAELVTLLLAAHEIRRSDSRDEFFAELSRIVTPGGRIVLAEHLRDWPNFLAFGPGFVHFHSRRTWLRAAERAGLHTVRELSITPFVRVFVFERKSS
jgi:SAM-dependent methyltransferase